jgi:hypothetical protein
VNLYNHLDLAPRFEVTEAVLLRPLRLRGIKMKFYLLYLFLYLNILIMEFVVTRKVLHHISCMLFTALA